MTRLTEEMVIARSRQSDLSSIKKLNCWGSDLSDVSIIKRMRGVEVLALSVNKITNLQDFEDCHNLQELYLRKNNIQDINQIAYLQSLPNLKYLWLEENPCCDSVGRNYRAVVLRALPNLKKLDNVDVTPEEVQEAQRAPVQQEDDVYEDAREQQQQQSQQQQQQQQQQLQLQQQQQPHHQQQQQQQRKSQSPIKERTPPCQDISPQEQQHTTSPMNNGNNRDQRMSYHQYDEYYQSDYQKPAHPVHYRHSQTDLTEWDENQQPNQYYNSGGGGQSGNPQRRSAGTEREVNDRFGYRNGNARERDDWEDNERHKRRPDGRFSDSASVVSNAVLNHYASYHRRPVNRSSNILSATLCLVKELDYPSLEVVEHAVRCRIDELSAE